MHIPKVFPQVSVVLFDLDDTLIDHSGAARRASISFAEQNGVTPDPQRWIEVENRWYKAFERGEVTYLGQRVERTREFLGLDLNEQEALSLYDGYLSAYRANWKPLPHALDALKSALTSYKVGIFTNGGRELQTSKLDVCGLNLPDLQMFPATELGAAKPQPESYKAVSDLLQTKASSIVLIGDNLINDVTAAQAAGFETIHLDPTGKSSQLHSISSVKELSFY